MVTFREGDRVELKGHWEFEDGICGTVWGKPSTQQSLQGPQIIHFVEFDEPHDDGSGDGPYSGAYIEADCLRHLSEVGKRSE